MLSTSHDLARMEISGSPCARGDRIYERANDFTAEVARLAIFELS